MSEDTLTKKLLVVEGRDDMAFFLELLKKVFPNSKEKPKHPKKEKPNYRIISTDGNRENIYILSLGGKGNFKEATITTFWDSEMNGKNELSAVGIILDAEDKEAAVTGNTIHKLLEQLFQFSPDRLGEPKKENEVTLGSYVMPDNTASGMLEDLCLRSIEDSTVYTCVEEYIKCASREVKWKIKNSSKAKALSYLAIQEEPVAGAIREETAADIGTGVQKAWGLENQKNSCFNDIKRFLLTLFH